MSKFDEAFCEPMSMSNGAHVVSGKYTREEAAGHFSDYIDYNVRPEALEKDRVIFGIPPDDIAEGDDIGECWYTCSNVEGSELVWTIG